MRFTGRKTLRFSSRWTANTATLSQASLHTAGKSDLFLGHISLSASENFDAVAKQAGLHEKLTYKRALDGDISGIFFMPYFHPSKKTGPVHNTRNCERQTHLLILAVLFQSHQEKEVMFTCLRIGHTGQRNGICCTVTHHFHVHREAYT